MTRSTLAESVAGALRHAIFQGAYLSGERLVELTIAQEMNVSQNTVRDALRLLEKDGLVVKRPRYGTHIRSYTADETQELYALWSAVEALALGWALPRITDEQITILADLVNRMHAAFLSDRQYEALENRFQFHAALATIANKPQTSAILRRLQNQIRLLENLRQAGARRFTEDRDAQIAHYQALVKAIRSKNLDQALSQLHACIEIDAIRVAAAQT